MQRNGASRPVMRNRRARAQPFEGVRVSDLEAFREIAESASMDGENP